MEIKYKTQIKSIGELVDEGIEEKIIILFNEDAPEIYQEYCFFHTIDELKEDIKAGDFLVMKNEEYLVTSVGDVANETLRKLGHTTIIFDGNENPQNPGNIHVENKEIIRLKENEELKFIG